MTSHANTPAARDRAGAERAWRRATLVLIAAHAVAAGLLFRDYGITYDEHWQAQHGENVLAWYGSGLRDRSFERHRNLRHYGGLFDVAAQAAARVSPFGVYETRHGVGAAFAVLAVAGVAALAARLAGWRGACFAALVAIATPRFFGHGFNNPKDVPFAALHAVALAAVLALLPHLPRPGRARVAVAGVAAGLAIGVRIGGLVVLAHLALLLGLFWLRRLAVRPARAARDAASLALVLAGAGAVAAAVMLPFWPAFQVDPLGGPLAALAHVRSGAPGGFDVFFDGRSWSIHELPASYVWTWLAISLPETYAVGLLLALAAAVAALARSGAGLLRRDVTLGWVVVLFAAVFPLAAASLGRPALYDGLRHFLFATLLLAVPAGAGVAWALAPGRPRALRAGAAALFACALALPAIEMVRLHPYQAVYFNHLVAGGLPRAAERFETDYWGSSFKEGAEWLRAHAGDGDRPRVASSAYPTQTGAYLPDDRFEFLGSVDHTPGLARDPLADPPDYYLATPRWDRHRLYPGRVVHRVERAGVPLLFVIEVDREAARRGASPADATEP